ncbi:MAG: murein L,D-transpeptidase, partial [Hyphomicrobium sp.]
GAPLLWTTEADFSERGRAVIAEIANADDWGLSARDFSVPQPGTGDLTPEAAAATEIELTFAVLKYARYARGGRIRTPSSLSKLLDYKLPLHAPKDVLAGIAASDAPDAYLQSLHPRHEQFAQLRQKLIKLRDPATGHSKLAYGEKLQVVLPPAGKASDETPRRESPEDALRIGRILVNMERWRWMPDDLGAVHVWNNVPEFLTRIVKDGETVHTDRIVVGLPDWPTPAFSADMKQIVFHPSWGVPDGIKRKELAPLLRKSAGGGLIGLFTGAPSSSAILEQHKLEAYYQGRPIDPNQVDWAGANIAAYEFRQPPGPTNVLGKVKFLFPNTHDVYMHDTPDRDLFGRSFRGLSHGCMRVGNPQKLAEVLLAYDKGWSAREVAGLWNGGTREVALTTHIPVHMTYFTAMVDDDGTLRTYGDLYGIDKRMGAVLLGKGVPFVTPRYETEIAAARPRRRQDQEASAGGPAGLTSLADAISSIFSP